CSVGRSASIASATLLSSSQRCRGVLCDHSRNAAPAAATASSTSAASLDATSSSTWPVAGSSTESVAPLRAGFHAPPMKLPRVIVRTSTSRGLPRRNGRYRGDRRARSSTRNTAARHDVRVVVPGQIVVLNGTSSSGKTSTALSFQKARTALGECWVIIGIDDFIGKLPRRWIEVGAWAGSLANDGVRLDRDGYRAHFHIGEQARRLLHAYRNSVREVARAGLNVLVDDVSLEEHEWRDWCAALEGLDPVWVAVRW